MSVQLRQVTSSVFIASAAMLLCANLAPVGVLQELVASNVVVALIVLIATFAWLCGACFVLIQKWDRPPQRHRSQTLKVIGQSLSAAAVEERLSAYEPQYMRNVSLERCGLEACPKTLVDRYSAVASLNLRGNLLTDVTPLCNLVSLRSLNLSGNALSFLPERIVALRRLRYLNTLHNPKLPEAFRVVTNSYASTQQLLAAARDHFSRASRCRQAVLALLAVKRYAPPDSVWAPVPRDVVLIIARMLFKERHSEAWKGNKLSRFFFINEA